MSDANPFTIALGEFRATYSLTQREIAKSMGVTDGNISKIERGLVVPTSNFIEKMFDAVKLEKGGYWYEKLHFALIRSRGKLVIDLENMSEEQVMLIVVLSHRVRHFSDEMCRDIRENTEQ